MDRRTVRPPTLAGIVISTCVDMPIGPSGWGGGTDVVPTRTMRRSAEQGGDERLRVEGDQVADGLPHPDEPDRDVESVLDGEDDAALGRGVELGQRRCR